MCSPQSDMGETPNSDFGMANSKKGWDSLYLRI